MYTLTILYGPPDDPAAFDAYYREQHIPLAARMTGFADWSITWCEAGPDGAAPAYHCIVTLRAESRPALEAALATDESRAASADVANFATGGATYIWGDETEVPFA